MKIEIRRNINNVIILERIQLKKYHELYVLCRNIEDGLNCETEFYNYLINNEDSIDLIKLLYSLEYADSYNMIIVTTKKYIKELAYLMTIGKVYIKFYNFMHYLCTFPALPNKLIEELNKYNFGSKSILLTNNYNYICRNEEFYEGEKYNHVSFIGYIRLYWDNNISEIDLDHYSYSSNYWNEFIKTHSIYTQEMF